MLSFMILGYHTLVKEVGRKLDIFFPPPSQETLTNLNVITNKQMENNTVVEVVCWCMPRKCSVSMHHHRHQGTS